jgi:hypothetical protein
MICFRIRIVILVQKLNTFHHELLRRHILNCAPAALAKLTVGIRRLLSSVGGRGSDCRCACALAPCRGVRRPPPVGRSAVRTSHDREARVSMRSCRQQLGFRIMRLFLILNIDADQRPGPTVARHKIGLFTYCVRIHWFATPQP